MNLLDKMFQMTGFGQETIQKPQAETVGQENGLWKESSSNHLKTMQNMKGYVRKEGKSMGTLSSSSPHTFTLAPGGWEERRQDLSPYCQKILLDISSGKMDKTESINSIAQDDELNTPEISIREFDYASHGGVLPEGTLPSSFYDDGIWDIPIIEVEQISQDIKDEDNTHTFGLEHSAPNDSEILECDTIKTENNFCSDEIWIGFEEEVTLTEEQDVNMLENTLETVKSTFEIVKPQNIGTSMLEARVESFSDKPIIITEGNISLETDIESQYISKGAVSLLASDCKGTDTGISLETFTSDYSPTSMDHISIEKTAELNSVTYTSKETESGDQIVTKQVAVGTNNIVMNDIMLSESQSLKGVKDISDLKLNLTSILRTDDEISTPVILENLLADEIPFETLMEFIHPDISQLRDDSFALGSTVDFTDVSVVPSNNSSNTTPEEVVKDSDNITKDLKVIIKKSPDGQLHIDQPEQFQESRMWIDGARKKCTTKEHLVRNKISKVNENFEIVLTEPEFILKPNVGKKKFTVKGTEVKIASLNKKSDPSKSSKRSTSKQPIPSTSEESTVVRASRVRKTSYKPHSEDYNSDISPAKRGRQSSVESESDKYRELRNRNNEASRKSRLSRKTREMEMREIAIRLERENQSLRIKAQEMERLVKKLRQALIDKVSKNKKDDKK